MKCGGCAADRSAFGGSPVKPGWRPRLEHRSASVASVFRWRRHPIVDWPHAWSAAARHCPDRGRLSAVQGYSQGSGATEAAGATPGAAEDTTSGPSAPLASPMSGGAGTGSRATASCPSMPCSTQARARRPATARVAPRRAVAGDDGSATPASDGEAGPVPSGSDGDTEVPRAPPQSASCDSWQTRRCRAPTPRLPSSLHLDCRVQRARRRRGGHRARGLACERR